MVSDRWIDHQRDSDWKSVSREKPCPVCGKPDWCRVADGDRLVTCKRSTASAGRYQLVKLAPAGGAVFRLDDGLTGWIHQPRLVVTKPQKAIAKPDRPVLWGDQAKGWQQAAGNQVQLLADQLGVSVASLRSQGCGWDDSRHCWTFPARDGDGQVIGIAQRLQKPRLNREGKTITKAMVTGSRQGLFFDPSAWSQGSGPILLVEGPTDTAAAVTMGLAAVGRPSNRGGIDHLAQLLRGIPADRPVVVVGENDQKPDGNWPGRDGAVSTATQLAKAMHRPILWAIVPDTAKDTRDFLVAITQQLGDRTTPQRIGQGLQAALLHDAETVAAAPAPITEQQLRPDGESRDLASWRRDVADAHQQAAVVPGVYLDRSPTGSGKTFAAMLAIQQASSSLTVLPTHANVRERTAEYLAAGIDAAAFPDLSETNCQNFGEAARAQAAGLPVGRTACIGCRFKKGCEYRREAAAASKAAHKLATHQRLIRSPGIAAGCQVAIIDENPVAVLHPDLAASPAGIRSVGDLAHRIMMRSLETGDKAGAATFARAMADTCAAIAATIGHAGEPGRYAVDLPTCLDIPDRWEAVLWRSMQRCDPNADPGSEALQLVTLAATGKLDRLDVVVEKTPGGYLSHLIYGAWRTQLDTDHTSYQLLDATAQADDVAAAAGVPVRDLTPEGHLPTQHRVVQIPLAITGSTSPAKVAGIVRGLMDRHPEFTRWGLIGLRRHIDAMMGEGAELLDADARSRVTKHCYFWQGPDRASNDWHQVCDVILVLGVPRPNPVAVRERLLLLGEDEAATVTAPVWGEIHWQADSTQGGQVTVPGRGFHCPTWRRAHRSLCQAQLLQAMGRARSVLEGGKACLVVGDEPTGAVVDTRPLQTLPWAVQALVDGIRRVGGGCELSAIGDADREKFASGTASTAALLADQNRVRQAAGKNPICRRALEKTMQLAKAAGLVHSPGRGLWQLTRPTDLPLVATGPTEPVTVADVAADPVPVAVTATTTDTASSDFMDANQALIDERAAILEFDAGKGRDEADHLAIEFVMGSGLTAGRSGAVHRQQVAGFRPARPPTPAREPPPAAAPHLPTGPQDSLWTPSELRQLNPWG